MLKCMIVDDEYLFRDALKISLPWEKLGYEVCCEAENGYDALDKIMEYRPDVALVDINMPVMDGLELAAEINEKGIDTKIIIITGYGEFTYARQAIQVGVENYLLKPIDEDELAEALIGVRSLIEKERASKLDMEALAQQAREHKPFLKEMHLNDLLQGSRFFGSDEIAVLKDYFGVDLDSRYYQAAVIEVDAGESAAEGQTLEIQCFAVADIARAALGDYCRCEFSRAAQGRLNVLVLAEDTSEDWQQSLVDVFERIGLSASKGLGITVTSGIGRPYEHAGQLAISYKEALHALKNKLVIGENSVIPYADVVEYKSSISFFPIEQKMQLHLCLRGGEYDEAEKIIGSVFGSIRQSNPSSEMARFVCLEIVSSLLDFMFETGCGVFGSMEQGFELLAEVQSRKKLDELEALTRRLLARLSASAGESRGKRPSKIVEDAVKYIEANYARFDLKIDDIAKNVFIKYGHLCFLFKRETGKTINEFISELRINKARELIDSGCHSISYVAAKVGYADANYFGKCFKKWAGITPGKYVELRTPGNV